MIGSMLTVYSCAVVSGRLKLSWLQWQFYVQGEVLCTGKKKYLKLFEFEIRGFLVAWEICLHCRRPVRICPPGSIPELGRSLRRGNGNLLQYSCLHGQSSLVGYSKKTWLSEFEINMNLLKSKICNIIFPNPLN